MKAPQDWANARRSWLIRGSPIPKRLAAAVVWFPRARNWASRRLRVESDLNQSPKSIRTRGVGRGISPRPQPQTGRASFQASGFPDNSMLVFPSQF